jgi:hypothetical protein
MAHNESSIEAGSGQVSMAAQDMLDAVGSVGSAPGHAGSQMYS